MKIKKISNYRKIKYFLLKNNKKKHCSINLSFVWDITDLLSYIEILQKKGSKISFISYFIKATSLIIKNQPRLNRKLYRLLFAGLREVQFKDINCFFTKEKSDGDDGTKTLNHILYNVDKMKIQKIHKIVTGQESEPALKNNVPSIFHKIHYYLLNKKPKLDAIRYGTYKVCSLIHKNLGCMGIQNYSSYLTFWLLSIDEHVLVHSGKPKIRKTITVGVGADHFILDGAELTRSMFELKLMLEKPYDILQNEFPDLNPDDFDILSNSHS